MAYGLCSSTEATVADSSRGPAQGLAAGDLKKIKNRVNGKTEKRKNGKTEKRKNGKTEKRKNG
jgi:hypothetical protein